MRVTSLTQPRCKITYKYLNIKILQQICLITWYKNTIFLRIKREKKGFFVSPICFYGKGHIFLLL